MYYILFLPSINFVHDIEPKPKPPAQCVSQGKDVDFKSQPAVHPRNHLIQPPGKICCSQRLQCIAASWKLPIPPSTDPAFHQLKFTDTPLTTFSAPRIQSLNIPKFSGTLREWLSFKELFHSLVHINTDISKVEKFHYLLIALAELALSHGKTSLW